jgi:hypothetical protein
LSLFRIIKVVGWNSKGSTNRDSFDRVEREAGDRPKSTVLLLAISLPLTEELATKEISYARSTIK